MYTPQWGVASHRKAGFVSLLLLFLHLSLLSDEGESLGGFLVEVKESQDVQHGLLDVASETVGVSFWA